MRYTTLSYYTDTYKGPAAGSEAETTRLLEQAEYIIDDLTNNNIANMGGLAALPSTIQEAIQGAACAQAEYMIGNGGNALMEQGSVASANIGSFGYTVAGADSKAAAICPMAKVYLRPTGLLYRGGLSVN